MLWDSMKKVNGPNVLYFNGRSTFVVLRSVQRYLQYDKGHMPCKLTELLRKCMESGIQLVA